MGIMILIILVITYLEYNKIKNLTVKRKLDYDKQLKRKR